MAGSVNGSMSTPIDACQRAFTSLAARNDWKRAEVLDLEVAEEVAAVQEDRVIAGAGRAQLGQHLRPDRGVAATVFVLGAGQQPHHEPDSLHLATSWMWSGPGWRMPTRGRD